jgi:hypothetical protein
MDETSTSAMLVGAPQSDGLTVTVPRDEIEAALTSDPPGELVLDILRKVEGTDEPQRRTVNVAWKRLDLESVIEDADTEAITFSFDPAELDRLLSEPDVESHGLREAAVVLSIAAAAAVAGASNAAAEPHGAGYTPVQVAIGGHDEMTFAARGIESGTPAATHDEMTFAARGIESGTPAATHDEMTFAARGIESGTPAATHDEMTFAARGIESTSPADAAPVSSGSRFDLPSVDPAMVTSIAAALGAFGLAILGASFVSRRREPGSA